MADASNTSPSGVVENIDEVVRIEEALTQKRTAGERLGDAVGSFAGKLAFIATQLLVVIAWVAINAGLVSGLPPFDPFPYSLGGVLLSLEGVLLASFVLIKQAHEARLSERRSHLILQANLLVEKEVTKVIQMLSRASAAEGNKNKVVDGETEELSQDTAVGKLAEELDRRLERD